MENAAKFDAQAACAYLGIANAAGAKVKDKELCGKAYKDADFLTDLAVWNLYILKTEVTAWIC